MIKEQILIDFDSFKPLLSKEGERLESKLKDLLSDSCFKIHSVATRVKSRESFRHKISRPDKIYNTLWDVTDVLGLRITTYVEDASILKKIKLLSDYLLKIRFLPGWFNLTHVLECI